MEESEPVALMKPGTKLSVIGNCVLVKCADEDDAIVFMEMLKSLDGKTVFVEEDDV